MHSSKIIRVVLLSVFLLAAWLWTDYQDALQAPAVIEHPVIIEIEKGDSFKQITNKLLLENLAIKPFWFKVIAVQTGTFKKLRTGEYELAAGLTMPQILALFVSGKTRQHAITIPEGWSFKQILEEIEKNPYIEHTVMKSETGEKASVDVLCFEPFGVQSPEGLIFPDTYFFEKHTSDISLLKRACAKMQQVLQQEWMQRMEGLPFKSAYEALILASIVEKETGLAAERPQIAGVFIRRLQTGMLLQTDPTVIYGMGENYKGDITYNDLKTATPYNTYVIKGLPPTPIAVPGREAIYAVLHPDNGNSLYFVARGDGTHVFSATLKEHEQAVDSFQRKKK